MDPEYLYFIKKNDITFFDINDAGDLVTTGKPIPLVFPPEAWQETSINNERNEEYFGVDRTITIPYKFVEDGGRILKKLAYEIGPEAQAQLVIMQKHLRWHDAPEATLDIGDLVANTLNTGTITSPNENPVYVRIIVTGTNGIDYVQGTIGSLNIGTIFPTNSPKIFTFPNGGSMPISLNYVTSSGSSTANVSIVNDAGYTITAFGFYYRLLMRGDIDMSSFLHAGYKVTVTILEGGLPKFLKANQSKEYLLDLDVPEAVVVGIDGVALHNKVKWVLAAVEEDVFNDPISIFSQVSTVPWILLHQEGEGYGLAYLPVNYERPEPTPILEFMAASENWMIKNAGTEPITLPLVGEINLNVVESDDGNINLWFQTSLDQTFQIIPDTPLVTGVRYHWSFSFTITLQPGEKLFPWRRIFGQRLTMNYEETSTARVEVATQKPTTYHRALPGLYIFRKLLSLMSNNLLRTYSSDMLSSIHDDLVFISGDGIRGIPGSKLPISMQTFFNFFNSIDDVGMGQKKGTCYMERKVDMVNYSAVTDIGEISFPEVSFINDRRFNSAKFGFPDIDLETVNGKEEFNASASYSLDVFNNSNELDKTTQVITACYIIENIRLTFEGKATTDGNKDNRVFCLHVEREEQPPTVPAIPAKWIRIHYEGDQVHYFVETGTGFYDTLHQSTPFPSTIDFSTLTFITANPGAFEAYVSSVFVGWDNGVEYTGDESVLQGVAIPVESLPWRKLNRDLNQYVTSGLLEPDSVFNLSLAYPFSVKRNGAYIRSVMFDQDSAYLKFLNAQRNSKVVITMPDGEIIRFDQNWLIGSLEPRYLKSILIKFRTEGVYNLLQELDADSLRAIQATFKGKSYIFVPRKVSIQPATLESQEYEMICGADTDLTPLIDYYGE